MKKVLCIITAIICGLYFTILCFAHSGKTDSNGGHYDSSTGEYHYHHGYSAHQHPNGDCPYDFDDKTNHGIIENDNETGQNYFYDNTQYTKEKTTHSYEEDSNTNDSDYEEKKPSSSDSVKNFVEKVWNLIVALFSSFCFSLCIFGIILPLLTIPFTAITKKDFPDGLFSIIFIIGCLVGTFAFLFIFI